MFVTSLQFRVAGVTFCNDNGTSRQSYISRLCGGDPLFISPFTFDGKPAFHISDASGHCIGNVPSVYVQDFCSYKEQGYFIKLCVDEILGCDESGNRIPGYNLGVLVDVDVYEDLSDTFSSSNLSDSFLSSPDPVETLPKPKVKKTGRVMIAFGIICAINAVSILNPMTAILAVIFLYFGIRRYRNFKK